RIEVLGDPLDRAALARGIATLEDDHEPRAFLAHPLLHGDQLRLQAVQLLLVDLAWKPALLVAVCRLALLRHDRRLSPRRRTARVDLYANRWRARAAASVSAAGSQVDEHGSNLGGGAELGDVAGHRLQRS